MSLNPDIRDQAYRFFIEEAQELLQVLETGLLNLREDHSTPRVHELMRAAHSIKGGAASIELDAIKTLAHRLEDFFKALYSEKVNFDPELENLLLQAYDCLKNPLVEQMEMGSFDAEFALVTAEPIFAQLETLLGDALQESDNYIPSANDLGVDIVASIFEVDVAQSLTHLYEVLTNPDNYDVIGELNAQIDLLNGFAELFNLSGFAEILQAATTALNLYPELKLDILQLTIADCQQAREQVLAGDRKRGGEPSPTLLALTESNVHNNFVSEDLFQSTITPQNELSTTNDFSFENLFDEIVDQPNTVGETISENLTDNFSVNQEVILDSAIDSHNSLLDDVFGSVEVQTETDLGFTQNLETNPSLDDVFGSVEVQTETDLGLPQNVENNPSLDDVFGAVDLTNNEQEKPQSSQVNELPPQNLEAAIESIEQIFEHLPSLEEDTTSLLPTTKQNQPLKVQSKPVQVSTNQPVVPTHLTVRVGLDRLERMNNLIGELVINRNSLSLQNEQLQDNLQVLVRKFFRFQDTTIKLRDLSDRLLIESERYNLAHPQINSRQVGEATDFDSLEMDSYGHLHSLLQGILEEMLQLEESVEDITLFAKQSNQTIEQQRQMLSQMRDELMWARMLPLEQILQRFPRTLRDLSNQYGKPVNLSMTGTGVLVDKAVLEKLYDPLLHLLRNAFDHGIETPEIRQQQGKSEQGQIEIHAYYQGNQTVIEVKDDGQGLNLTKIANKAVKQGLLSTEEATHARKQELFNLIFESGFSTADRVSEISGRGVGMNVVRSQILALKGTIEVNSVPGKGTTFTLRLPLTLTIAKLLVVSLGSTAFALPSDNIEEIIIPTEEQIKVSSRKRFFLLKQQLIPIYSLKEVLHYNCILPPVNLRSKAFETVAAPKDWGLPLLLLRQGQQLFALEIDSLITEQELVIKPFGKVLTPPSYIYGCTIMGDGTLIPVINGNVLIDRIQGNDTTRTTTPLFSNISVASEELTETTAELDHSILSTESTNILPATSKTIQSPTIMIVDDSTALRRTMALSLEKSGYRVVQAKDGREALEQYRKNSAIALIVCDIEMPNMNGFEFLGVRRRDSELSNIPIVMLTSRSGVKHRSLAMQLGANAYFTKPYIEQEFLVELKKILNPSVQKTIAIPKTLPTQTILVIDDSSALRKTMALSLEKKGYRVLQARDGQEGLEQLKQNPQVNLVICDVEMPNMNGFEFLTARRQEVKLAKIPVAMLTSRTNEKHRNLAQQLGAIAYFTKPYVEEEFFPAILNLIRN
ncbi:CheA signal transduction histidine kinase [Stanieria cyanosphaera PCC 7437]|uniref:histidine kinase n=1 Tax=Stanieria cyanosphaera (strain ATCC 29371 / PCC 7437) TaxID=111780 RepID=K9XZ58_STAC7|nr:response regulator [Stanieria cyanosphaera]AFZ37885.1 CheA signal transduction histidine kinase [Stanieria cyanosphaera PCC 7437]